jgi:hypothetical protein
MFDKNPRVAAFKSPVHVAVICPPQAAITMLLNVMGEHGGMFVLMQQIPLQVGAVAKVNGQPNIQLYPMLVFAIQKDTFESWLKVKYDAQGMYQMAEIIEGKIGRSQNPILN